jgi:DNA repair protein RecN (Recombination protein N)
MLLELRIKNFVIIDSLKYKLHKRALTSSLVKLGLVSLSLLMLSLAFWCEKLSTDMIRTGFDKAALEAVFDISSLEPVQSILQDSGIDIEDDQLILRREIFANGKGRCFANSVQITVAKLKRIADSLVDIHGQNEHQTIINIARHRELLDSFGNLKMM